MTSQSAFTEVAALAGDPARAGMLHALMDGRALTASELARGAGITPQTASGHLARLVTAGLLSVERQGRHRYHRLASPAVAQMVEGIMQVASGLGDGVDAPRRHLCAKVTVSNCHRRRRPWSRLPRSVWTSRSTCSRYMERIVPGMCCFASASLAGSFSVFSRRKPRVSLRWKPVPARTTGRVRSLS